MTSIKEQNEYNIKRGADREDANKNTIELVFDLNLTHSHWRYNHFDWFDPNRLFVVEHKSYSYPFNLYKNTMLKSNKILNSNSLFIFEFLDPTSVTGFSLYYLQFSSKLFSEFELRWCQYRLKMVKEQMFIISNNLLTPFDVNTRVVLRSKRKNHAFISSLIDEDAKRGSN